MKIKSIIFDFDETLVDTEDAHLGAWRHVLGKSDKNLPLEEYFTYVGHGDEKIAELLCLKKNLDSPSSLLSGKRAQYLYEKSKIKPIQATIDFIFELEKQKASLGIKLAIATAAPKEEILPFLKDLKILDFFDLILSGTDLKGYQDPEGCNKPKSYIYLEAAKQLHCKPNQCIVIEDSYFGVTAGISAGCITIAVPNEYTKHQDLSHADLKLESLEGLTPASFLKKASKIIR